MTKNQATAAGILIEVVAWAHSVLSGVLVTVAIIVIGAITVRVHPRVRHTGFGSCHGTGESHNFLFRWRFRKCGKCSSGRLISPMAGHFGTDPIRGEYAKAKEARKTAKKNHSWR